MELTAPTLLMLTQPELPGCDAVVLRVARILARGGLDPTDEPEPPPRSPRTSAAGTTATAAATAADADAAG